MTFELQYTDSKTNARAGLITTDHGQIETPIFMPVGTLGTVKGVHLTELKEDIKAQIILGNTWQVSASCVKKVLSSVRTSTEANTFSLRKE